MPIPRSDDGDEFRAMGYVAVYAAYVEELVAECFGFLRPHDPDLRGNPWSVAAQIDSCLRAIAALPEHPNWPVMTALFREARRLVGERNIAMHSPLYAHGAGNIRRARNPENADAYVTADGIYALAEELFELQNLLIDAAVRLPRFLREAPQGPGQ